MILITGDMTDAGIATEWAEFLDAVDTHPTIAERMLILPGNHDLNIVDRLNPARIDLPFSPKKRLRQMRTLSALAAIQGHRVRVVDRNSGTLDRTLAEALLPHRHRIGEFADTGSLGIDPDAKEAILFALLGNEALSGEPIKIGTNPAVLMGKFSFPM